MIKLPITTEHAISEMQIILKNKIIPFWLNRSIDNEYGGYLTVIDEKGKVQNEAEKCLVTQARMLWGFSALGEFAAEEDAKRISSAARQGYEFLIEKFLDREYGGFFWKTDRAGNCKDSAKLSYGQSFAIYALSEFAIRYGHKEACTYAENTFSAMQVYAADTLRGGYYENMESDWSPANGGFYAGDRKSLDIHMHLMECYTALYLATGKEIHRRKLLEVIDIILSRMINREYGYGYNQFDLDFNKIPAIDIYRTWNADRGANEKITAPTDTTSYGHNTELSWLIAAAYDALGIALPEDRAETIRRLLDHSIKYGYDHDYGGVYRDGVANEPVMVTDKEWWQNFEAMVGYLNGYYRFGEESYCHYFEHTWEFIKKYFLVESLGESRQLLKRNGDPVISEIGNPWKGIYHTGRSLAECIKLAGKIKGN